MLGFVLFILGVGGRRDGIEEDICSALLQPRFTLPIGGREGLYYRMLEGDGGLQVCR